MGRSRLLSRTLITWFELLVVGIIGGTLGTLAGGPVGYLAYLAVALVSVGVLLYNVNALITARLEADTAGHSAESERSE